MGEEDTAPNGHATWPSSCFDRSCEARLESLVAFAERIRSLALKQKMGISLADLKATEDPITSSRVIFFLVVNMFVVVIAFIAIIKKNNNKMNINVTVRIIHGFI